MMLLLFLDKDKTLGRGMRHAWRCVYTYNLHLGHLKDTRMDHRNRRPPLVATDWLGLKANAVNINAYSIRRFFLG